MGKTDPRDLSIALKCIRRELRDEYQADHSIPWVVGFSGGKDSTLVLQLVFETLLSIAPGDRRRRIHVASNDTLVESPVIQDYVNKVLDQVRRGAEALGLPIEVVQTHPDADETFWVNLLGRGYPAPNRTFRWCTDRMKIRPTTRMLLKAVSESGEAILLLGARRVESAQRAQRAAQYDRDGRLSRHNDVKNCMVYRPIAELTDDDVWTTLLQCRPPWGGSHNTLSALYRDAQGGECPFVTSQDDAPSCGTSSTRFGCWTCTVVEKDNSLAGFIDTGAFDHLEPLFDFRNRLKEISGNPDFRSKTRRSGQPGLGPLTFAAREMLLDELLAIQDETGFPLITQEETRRVRAIWEQDRVMEALREARGLERSAAAHTPEAR